LPLLYSSTSGAWSELRIMLPDACNCWNVLSWKLTVTSGCAVLNSSSALVQAMPSALSAASNHQMLNVFCCAKALLLISSSDAVAASATLDSAVVTVVLLIADR